MLTLEPNRDQKRDYQDGQTEKTKKDRNEVYTLIIIGPIT